MSYDHRYEMRKFAKKHGFRYFESNWDTTGTREHRPYIGIVNYEKYTETLHDAYVFIGLPCPGANNRELCIIGKASSAEYTISAEHMSTFADGAYEHHYYIPLGLFGSTNNYGKLLRKQHIDWTNLDDILRGSKNAITLYEKQAEREQRKYNELRQMHTPETDISSSVRMVMRTDIPDANSTVNVYKRIYTSRSMPFEYNVCIKLSDDDFERRYCFEIMSNKKMSKFTVPYVKINAVLAENLKPSVYKNITATTIDGIVSQVMPLIIGSYRCDLGTDRIIKTINAKVNNERQ